MGLAGPVNDVFDGVDHVGDVCEFRTRDAQFIAAARTIVPLLVYEVDRRDAEIRRLQEQVAQLTGASPDAARSPLRLVS
ncbi:hypothetical protein [Agromyces humi]|uniref:hypothetical protein n=1 Tax=Agromyces humi TaxID=1766800 RepID=UPI00135B3A4E|nr:hypothetical protein [Agromyces humi]